MEGSIVETVRAIRPCIEEHRDWAHEHSRLAPDVLAAMRRAGAFTLVAPRENGGIDASYPDLVEVQEEIGYADPSVAWHVANSTYLAQITASVPADYRARIFDDPPGPYGFAGAMVGQAIEVEGGYRLSGNWPFMTGALDTTWSLFRGTVMDGDKPKMVDDMPVIRSFLLPATDYEIQHTWGNASSMRGTGSHGVAVHDVFVPEALVLPLSGGRPVVNSHASRLPSGAANLITTAPIVVGQARRVLEETTRIAAGKQSVRIAYRDMPDRQLAIARANAVVTGLRASVRAMAHEVEANLGERPADVPATVRARMWATMFWVLDEARSVVSDLASISTSSFYSSANPIEMGLRDVQAICATMANFRNEAERAAGRVYLGMEPQSMIF